MIEFIFFGGIIFFIVLYVWLGYKLHAKQHKKGKG
jgi:hypothetical protein